MHSRVTTGLFSFAVLFAATPAASAGETPEPPLVGSPAAEKLPPSVPPAGGLAALIIGSGTSNPKNGSQSGGRDCPGCCGPCRFGIVQMTIGPGQTQNFNWQINDAKGVAGPMPDANNQVDGWDLIRVKQILGSTGNLTWTATNTPGNQFNMALQTLIFPTTVGQDVQGPMNNFHAAPFAPPLPSDGNQSFSWPFITWQGTYTGPTDDATLTASTVFDLTNFDNRHPGTFSLHYDGANKAIDLVYTAPVPEPGTLALTVFGLAGILRRARRPAAGKPQTA
ncbi:MAG TPA: PEP-CTERM sorting domain-containing protein [Gemmataceae bacterium]|nr:PEP-CTERM sorting domain-containing protein [Gemmataceae bacterium]